MPLDQAFAKNLQDFIHGVSAAPTITTGRKIRLFPAAGTSTSAGTEITAGGGYTAGGYTLTFSAATAATPSVSGNVAFSITNMPAAPTIAGLDFVDTSGTPVRLEYGSLTQSKTTAAGDTLSWTTSSIQSSLS